MHVFLRSCCQCLFLSWRKISSADSTYLWSMAFGRALKARTAERCYNPPPAFFSRRNDLHRCSWPTAPALCARKVSCLHLRELLFKGVTEAHQEGGFFFGKANALQHSSLLARLGRERDLAGTETHSCKLRHGSHAPPQPGSGPEAALPPASVPGHPSPPCSASTHLWRPGKLHGKRPHRASSRCVCVSPPPPAIPQPSLSDPFEAAVASGQAGGISFGKAESPPSSHALGSAAGCSTPGGRAPVARLPSKPSSARARTKPETTTELSSGSTAHT